jgi:RND family efflux transporter MFP subunit
MSRPRLLLPLAFLAAGMLGALTLVATRPRVETQPAVRTGPMVRVLVVQPQEIDLVVRTQGTVLPRTESAVVAEVAGTVVWVSPSLVSGGFFEEGEPLLRIDPRDYALALEQARAASERAESEHRLARKELGRRRGLAERDAASPAQVDAAVNAERVAGAAARQARAALGRAELDRARTEIVAPYAGRVREAFADVGQFVARGARVARVYAIDRAEVRLPVPDRELRFLDLPLLYRGETRQQAGPEVRLRARFAGHEYQWTGRVVRTEGEIDPKTRMVNVVAQVDDPYGRGDDPDRPPLAVGLFVEADLYGQRVPGVFVVPRAAMRDPEHVLVVDGQSRLRIRRVGVLRADRREVVIQSGLEPGQRVVVSPLEAAVDGMTVRVAGEEPADGEARS